MDVMIEIVTKKTTRFEVTGRNQIARRKRYRGQYTVNESCILFILSACSLLSYQENSGPFGFVE